MAGEKKQITRNRISYSCKICRQRKVRCDKVRPVCGACQKTGEECSYATGETDITPDHDTLTTEANHGKKRKQSLEGSHGDYPAWDDVSNRAPDLEDQLLQLSVLLSQLSSITGIAVNNQASSVGGHLDTSSAHGDVLTPESQQPHHNSLSPLADSERRRQMPGPGHPGNGVEHNRMPDLDTISAQLEQLTTLLRLQRSGIGGQCNPEPVTTQQVPSLMQLPGSNANNALLIPTETQRNVLFRCWLSSVYPVLPIVDPAVALMHYRTFHFWYTYGLEKGISNPSEEYVPLIFAIYYAGTVSMSLRGIRKWFPGAQRKQLLNTCRRQFLETLTVPAKLLSHPVVLAARVMMCYMSSEDDVDIGFTSAVVSLVRAAYACNLHREKPNKSLETGAAEVRRRLWWEIVNLDILESTASNMPPSINHRYCNTLMPNEVKDSKLDTTEADQYESALQGGHSPDPADDPSSNDRSSMVSVIYVVERARLKFASYARNLLTINLATRPKTKEDMVEIRRTLEEMSGYANTSIARIPAKGIPELDFTPSPGKPGQSVGFDHGKLSGDDLISSEVDAICGVVNHLEPWEVPYVQQHRNAIAAFHKWARILLSMYIDQSHCYSYAPFLSNTKRKLWVSARQCALRHAHSCLRKFNALASDLELERFRWTWPGMHQPIHACVIILLDTYERPMSREASRSRALFDQMLILSSPEHGIVRGEDGLTNVRPLSESGTEAFTMLMQLRAKAWHAAGLDPSVLWTEQDQIDIGVATPLTETEKIAQSMREDVIFDSASAGHQGKHFTSNFRPIIEQRSKEHIHPSEVGVPDENDTHITYSECAGHTHFKKRDGQRFPHARPDQERTPGMSPTQGIALAPQAGHTYRFKLPSELYDVGQLIRKIKSVQQSGKIDQVENPSAWRQQIAAANNDLTNFLAQELPANHSDGTTERQGVPSNLVTGSHVLSRTSKQPTPGPSAGPSPNSDNTSQSQRDLPLTDPTTNTSPNPNPNPCANANDNRTTSNFTSAHVANTDRTAPPAPVPDSNTTNAPIMGTNMTDLINMDFDWAKWDEVFGHILDDGFPDTGADGMDVEGTVFHGTLN